MKPEHPVVHFVSRLAALAFCVFCFVTFGELAHVTVEEIRFGQATWRWQPVPGTVESSWVQEGRKSKYDVPRIGYRYEAGGHVVRSDEVGAWGDHDTAQSLVAAYPVGAEVTVHYDPESRMSVLGRGVDSDSHVRLAMCAVFLAGTAGFAGWLVLEALPWLGIRRPFGTDRLFVAKPVADRPQRNATEDWARKAAADRAMEGEIAERKRERAREQAHEQAHERRD